MAFDGHLTWHLAWVTALTLAWAWGPALAAAALGLYLGLRDAARRDEGKGPRGD